MSLYLDVVCTEARLTSYERQEKSVQVIGEILPYVLAKYGVSIQLPVRNVNFPLNVPNSTNCAKSSAAERPRISVRRLDF